MSGFQKDVAFRWWYKRKLWVSLLIVLFFWGVRLSKGAVVIDFYSLLLRPFFPGSAQKEWIEKSAKLEQQIKLDLIEKDNQRLRRLLSLQKSSKEDLISAAVISRRASGFWQQLEINKGFNVGIEKGNAVIGPGGLLGIVQSVTSTTSRVRLLTSPGSKVGVWVERTKQHGVLIGNGTNRPQINFLDKNPEVELGDVLSTSPASTLMPPNLPVGVIQLLEPENLPAPYGLVQLIAAPEAIDWVQVLRR